MVSKKTVNTLLVSAVALTIAGAATTANASPEGKEKCYGVVKAGSNDCAGKGHSCAGQASADADGNEFVALPKGVCDKLAGGSTTPASGDAGHKGMKMDHKDKMAH